MRLIDADTLWRVFEDTTWWDNSDRGEAQSLLEDAPAIDAMPVVRCGECKWYDSAFYACSKCGICVDRDFFCADGERMDGKENG